jgi:hypothetical protein
MAAPQSLATELWGPAGDSHLPANPKGQLGSTTPHGTQATTHEDPILNHLNIPWRLAKYLSASITPFICSTPTHLSQSHFSIYLVNAFNGNLESCESGN